MQASVSISSPHPKARPYYGTPKDPPMLSGAVPVLGHGVEFIRSTVALLTRAQRELGEVAGIKMAHRKMVAMFGPEAHEAVFRAPDTTLSIAEPYKIMTPVFGEGMVYDAPPEKMAEQFKMLLPALKDKRMRTYAQTVVKEVEQAIESWGDEGLIDLVDFCRVLTNFTSAASLLGREFREDMTDEFAKVYNTMERGVTPLSYISANLPLPSFRARDKARVRLVEMIGDIVASRRRSGRREEDFLQTLMEARYKTGESLTDHEITGMLLASMFAGHHTSSVTTAWTILELLRNPACRRTVLEQTDALFGQGEEISFESLRDYTEGEYAVLETLRLHPPLFMLVRVAQEDWHYKQYRIPKGTWILISPAVAQQVPEYFKDSKYFDPQRFAPERVDEWDDYSYIPFGAGRHRCMGNAFALLQLKAIIAILLREYEFFLTDDPIGTDFHGLVVGPKLPCRVRYRRRDPTSRMKNRVIYEAGHQAVANVAQTARSAGCPFHGENDVSEAEPRAQKTPKKRAKKTRAKAKAKAGAYRVVLDRVLCKSHGVCMGEAPQVFHVGEESQAEILQETPAPNLRKKVELAVKHCPTKALRIVE